MSSLRNFTQFDWDGWAGAEPGPNGAPPRIGEIKITDSAEELVQMFPDLDKESVEDIVTDGATVIVDGNGVSVYLGYSGMFAHQEFSWTAALEAGSRLVTKPWSIQDLALAGYDDLLDYAIDPSDLEDQYDVDDDGFRQDEIVWGEDDIVIRGRRFEVGDYYQMDWDGPASVQINGMDKDGQVIELVRVNSETGEQLELPRDEARLFLSAQEFSSEIEDEIDPSQFNKVSSDDDEDDLSAVQGAVESNKIDLAVSQLLGEKVHTED